MSPTSAITKRTIGMANASFADGGQVLLREEELGALLTRRQADLGLDDEYAYVVVGVHWSDSIDGLVLLPDHLIGNDGDKHLHDYSRVDHIDHCIEALQRARALLMHDNSEV